MYIKFITLVALDVTSKPWGSQSPSVFSILAIQRDRGGEESTAHNRKTTSTGQSPSGKIELFCPHYCTVACPFVELALRLVERPSSNHPVAFAVSKNISPQ